MNNRLASYVYERLSGVELCMITSVCVCVLSRLVDYTP